MASPALRDDYGDEPQQQPRRRHPHIYAPYSTTHEHWPTCVADAVDKALERGQDGQHHHHESAAPMMGKRQLFASKMELTAQSAINMAAYLERRAVLMRSSNASADALPTITADRSSCGSEEADRSDDEDDDKWTMCCICLEKNRPNDTQHPVEALQCGHVFHRDCIAQWMSYKRCCPVDRLELTEDA